MADPAVCRFTVLETADDARRNDPDGTVICQATARLNELREDAGVVVIEPGEVIPVRYLGEGSCSTVEECLLNGKRVAVKRLKPELIAAEREVEGFVNEGALIATLNHPGIVHIVGLGFHFEADGNGRKLESMFIAQELCSGGSLRSKVLAQMNGWPEIVYTYANALRWCIQLSEGLAYLHSQRPLIIHRDLKLDNVLLTDDTGDAAAKIADFGLMAMVSSDGLEEVLHDLTGLTGSFLHMAPEVVLCRPYNEFADIFSLTVIIYEIFSKCVATPADMVSSEHYDYAFKVAQGYRPPLPLLWGLPLAQLVSSSWSQDPDERLSASGIAKKLQEIGESGDIERMDREEQASLKRRSCCNIQ